MNKLIATGLAVALIVAGCSQTDSGSDTAPPRSTVGTSSVSISTVVASPPDARRPVILDYSPTVSDIGALAFVASHPSLKLIAVTLPGTGESYCDPGVAHTRGVLTSLGLEDVPVACGPDKPLTGWNAFPTTWRIASNELELPEEAPNETRSAPELLSALIGTSTAPIDLIAVGPLTNVALALQADPSLAERLGGITVMGGAIDVPGNVFRNEVAEWNIWVDPTAAGVVIASGASVTMVPLDATNYLPTGPIFWESLDAAATTPAARLVRDIWESSEGWIENSGDFYFWDELAAAVLVDESLVTFETRTLVVDDETRENKGWTRQDPTGTAVRVAVSADRRAFEQLFLDILAGVPSELRYLDATPAEARYFSELEDIEAATTRAIDQILEATAADFDPDGDDFFKVAAAAVPAIFLGPWTERISALDGTPVPPGLQAAHDRYRNALIAFQAAEAELIAALNSGEVETFEALFDVVGDACRSLQSAADVRLVPAHLRCD